MIANQRSAHPHRPRPRASRAILGFAVLTLIAAGALQGDDLTKAELIFPVRRADFKPWRQQFYEFNLHTIGDIFRKNYDHGQPWAASASHLLDDLAGVFAELPGAISSPVLKTEALAVVGQGCDDPMVLYACGIGYQTSQEIDQAIAMYAKAFARFQVTAYPSARTFACLARLMNCRSMKERSTDSPETEAVIRDWISYGVKALHEVSVGDVVGRQYYAKILGPEFDGTIEIRERLHTALIAEIDKGGVDPWLGAVVKGYSELDRAWAARGNGYGNTVTEAGWKGFAEHLDLAEKDFSAAWALDQTLAQAPAGMINVCKGKSLGFAAEKMWMNRVLSAQMDFKDAYGNLFNAWQPRWGGTHEAILAVGRQALATKAFDTDVPEVLLRAFNSVARDMKSTKGDPNQVWRNGQVWTDIQVLFDGYLAEPSREAVRDWDLSRYAAYAWKCGKNDQTTIILKRIKGKPDADIFQDIAQESLDTAQKAVKGASDF
jgi:hypothetical protein